MNSPDDLPCPKYSNAKNPNLFLTLKLKNFFGFLQDNVVPGLEAASIEDSPVLTVQQAGYNLKTAVKRAVEELL